MLAETVSLDGGALLVALVVAMLVFTAAAGVVVLGFVLAPRAARGSAPALAGWVAVLVVEVLFCVASLGVLLEGDVTIFVFLLPALVVAQVMRFVSARRAE